MFMLKHEAMLCVKRLSLKALAGKVKEVLQG